MNNSGTEPGNESQNSMGGEIDTMVSVAAETVQKLEACSKTLVTAESCTAGLVADTIANIPGASKVLWGGFVTYTVNAKVRMLGIDEDAVNRFGAVSKETASAMALGALKNSSADISASVTGLAGPAGDGGAAPVGTVWIALAFREKTAVSLVKTAVFHFTGKRNEVRLRAAKRVLQEIVKFLDDRGCS